MPQVYCFLLRNFPSLTLFSVWFRDLNKIKISCKLISNYLICRYSRLLFGKRNQILLFLQTWLNAGRRRGSVVCVADFSPVQTSYSSSFTAVLLLFRVRRSIGQKHAAKQTNKTKKLHVKCGLCACVLSIGISTGLSVTFLFTHIHKNNNTINKTNSFLINMYFHVYFWHIDVNDRVRILDVYAPKSLAPHWFELSGACVAFRCDGLPW